MPQIAQNFNTGAACQELRQRLIASGQVQGVGFRPYVWRLAKEEGLAGFIQNTAQGVAIEIQGSQQAIASFNARFRAELPPLAKIVALDSIFIPTLANQFEFKIAPSSDKAARTILVSPDIAICADCLADIRDPDNQRFNYPFANCTNCGPRYSITRNLPYDRISTSMACFPLCSRCAEEYADPGDRRFHAQPIACPECGPKIWLVSKAEQKAGNSLPSPENTANAFGQAGALLLKGGIVAIRGLGGFQLACDARNAAAVADLRKRKQRPHKALAIMVRDLESAMQFCKLDSERIALLAGKRKPVVLCPALANPVSPLAENIAPDSLDIGVMLPYTPLHALLMDWLARHGVPEPALVMTSANPTGEPICLGNREALTRLNHIADAWLLHDRDILCRVDDSVIGIAQNKPIFFRRARGYTPNPVSLPEKAPAALGAGALLKATFCLTREDLAFVGQHIGDLETPACLEFYEEALKHLQNLLAVDPQIVVADLHPDLMSTQFAREMANTKNIPFVQLQHHAAHAAAVLAENNCFQPALALCLDGTGLGADGSIWGGELLLVDLGQPAWQRLGSLASFPLPGGEVAIKEPWRIATALQWQVEGSQGQYSASQKPLVEMLAKNINCPLCSSAGRLFDAVAAALGLCEKITYEGQAAIRLEKAAQEWLNENGEYSLEYWQIPLTEKNGLAQINTQALFAQLLKGIRAKEPSGLLAASFHYFFASSFSQMAVQQANRCSIQKIGLSGGVFQNRIIATILPKNLRQAGLEPFMHKDLPPGDGGLSFGQAVWGGQVLKKGKI